jgi:hypothetical protein
MVAHSDRISRATEVAFPYLDRDATATSPVNLSLLKLSLALRKH